MKRLQVRALPTTLLIGQDRKIVLREVGLSDAKSIVDALEALLPEEEASNESE